MIYTLLRPLLIFALRQFFSSITVRGEPQESGAALIVGNHPNLALDSMVISSGFRRELWYLGKATLFQKPLLRRLLTSMHVAPLYRKQDDPSLMGKNQETFRAVADLLKASRAVLLFPEGTSLGERNLQPLKTGAARMAFQAERESGFTLGLKIQAVGITYSDLDTFRSSVTVVYGTPFEVRPFRERFLEDERSAVQELTAAIEESLRVVAVSIASRDHEQLVENIAKVYRSTRSELDDRERFSIIARQVETLAPALPEQRAAIEREINSYLAECRSLQLEADAPIGAGNARKALKLLLYSPLTLPGFVVSYPMYRLIGHLVRWRASRPAYEASGKFLFGLVLFPLWYLALAIMIGIFLSSLKLGLLTLMLLLIAGYAVNKMWEETYLLLLHIPGLGGRRSLQRLIVRRDRLIEQLESLRIE